MSTKSRKPKIIYVKVNKFYRFVKCKKKEACGYIVANGITCNTETLILTPQEPNPLKVNK